MPANCIYRGTFHLNMERTQQFLLPIYTNTPVIVLSIKYFASCTVHQWVSLINYLISNLPITLQQHLGM